MAKTNNTAKFNSMKASIRGTGIQSKRAKMRANIGAKKNTLGLDEEGLIGSLINSLTPSAIGCRRP